MDRHEWTDPEDEITYTVTNAAGGWMWGVGARQAPLVREILRLAEENRGLKAPVLLDDQEVLVGAAEVARRANEEIQAVAERFSVENQRLAEEVRIERERANGTRIASDNALTRINADILKAVAVERARIRRELEAEVRAFLDQEIHPDDPLVVGRLAERSFFAESLRLSLDRIVPGES